MGGKLYFGSVFLSFHVPIMKGMVAERSQPNGSQGAVKDRQIGAKDRYPKDPLPVTYFFLLSFTF